MKSNIEEHGKEKKNEVKEDQEDELQGADEDQGGNQYAGHQDD